MKNPPENSTILNICIIPPPEISDACVALSQSLKSGSTLFVLDGKTKFAHMTVYMARFSDEAIPSVIAAVKKALESMPTLECRHEGYFTTGGRYFEVSYQKSQSLMDLQELIIKNLKDLRFNPGNPPEENYYAPYVKEQQKNAKETGYDLAYNLYRPHITLTRYKEGQVPEHDPKFTPTDLSFKPYSICIYKADDNGAVYEKLAEYPVKDPRFKLLSALEGKKMK